MVSFEVAFVSLTASSQVVILFVVASASGTATPVFSFVMLFSAAISRTFVSRLVVLTPAALRPAAVAGRD